METKKDDQKSGDDASTKGGKEQPIVEWLQKGTEPKPEDGKKDDPKPVTPKKADAAPESKEPPKVTDAGTAPKGEEPKGKTTDEPKSATTEEAFDMNAFLAEASGRPVKQASKTPLGFWIALIALGLVILIALFYASTGGSDDTGNNNDNNTSSSTTSMTSMTEEE